MSFERDLERLGSWLTLGWPRRNVELLLGMSSHMRAVEAGLQRELERFGPHDDDRWIEA
jgi:hypothetical protein